MCNKSVIPQISCTDGLALFGQYFSIGARACVGHIDTFTVKRPAVEFMKNCQDQNLLTSMLAKDIQEGLHHQLHLLQNPPRWTSLL